MKLNILPCDPPSCWSAWRNRRCNSGDQHRLCFLRVCDCDCCWCKCSSPPLPTPHVSVVELVVVAGAEATTFTAGAEATAFTAAGWRSVSEKTRFFSLWNGWNPPQLLLFGFTSTTFAFLPTTRSGLDTSFVSGDGFHNWTDLSQSDFFLSTLFPISSGVGDSCSPFSSIFLVGINSSKTGPPETLVVCSEHCSEVVDVLGSSFRHASIAT